jgi:hypothetical protein
MNRHRSLRHLAAAVLALGLSGCAATTYDASIPTTIAGVAETTTTTTLPTGTAAELLPELVADAAGLSTLIVDKGDDIGAAERIADLWQAVKQEVAASRPELLGDFEGNVAACLEAAKRDRPADADKAYLNLQTLAAAFLG